VAKQFGDATARMFEAARLCAGSLHESAHPDALRNAAEELRDITTSTADTLSMQRKSIQCVGAAQNATSYGKDIKTREILIEGCKQLLSKS
jgi:talin